MVSLSRQFSLASLTGLALLCLVSPVWAVDGRIQAIRYDAATRHFQINTAGNVKAAVNTLNIAGHKRIIIDVDNAEIGTELPRDVQLLHALSRQLPALKNVTVNQYAGNGRPIVRILIDIQGDPGTIRLVRNQGSQIELELNESANLGRNNDYNQPRSNNYGQPPSLSRLNQPAATRPEDVQPAAKPPVYGQNQLSDDDLRRTLSILNGKYENLSQENRYLKAKLDDFERNQSASDSTRQRSQETENRLRADINRLSGENSRLQNQLNNLENEKQRPDPAVATQRAEINRLKSENQSLGSRLSTALAASKGVEVDEMKRTLAEMNRRYDLLVKENQGLQSKISAQTSQTATLSASKAQFERLNEEKERLTERNESLNAENSRLKAELQKAGSTQNKLVSASDTDLQALRKQVTVAQSSLSESIRTINEQNKEIAYLRNQVNNVQGGLDASSQEQIATLQNEISQLKKSVQAGEMAKKELANTKAELENLKKSPVSTKSNSADQQAIARLTREKQTLRDELDSLKMAQQQASAGTEKATQLQTQLTALQADLSDMKAKYNQAVKETAQAKDALKTASAKNTAKATPAIKPDATLQKQIDSLNQQLASLKQENGNLRASLSATPVNRKTSANSEAEQDYNAAKTALGEKKTELALSKFKEALLLDADNSKYATDYSIALAEDRQYAEAIDVLRRYLQRNPGDRDAYNQLGKVYLLNDQPDAANQAFTRAIPLSVLNNYATSLKKVGDIAEAESVFKLALTVNPKDSEVLFNLGNLYNAEGKVEEARNKYLEAIQVRPNFAEAHYNVGLIFSKLGDNAKAVTHLEKYLQLSPNARNAETIRAYMQKLKA